VRKPGLRLGSPQHGCGRGRAKHGFAGKRRERGSRTPDENCVHPSASRFMFTHSSENRCRGILTWGRARAAAKVGLVAVLPALSFPLAAGAPEVC